MQTKKISVGSDIIYHCSRCGLDLGHTVLAMVGADPARVRCNTCRSERNYRGPSSVQKILRPKAAPRPKVSSSELYHQKLKESALKSEKDYSPKEHFDVGDVVQHPKFGRGVVLKTTFPDRVEIIFADQIRTLSCQLQG